ncbi:hypothetical protein RND81_06G113900 [Saponaria officinalis]|uniref:Uncharacterized protein n=1 Tax=Saponaria officinalis TaxID=3572 RepID=A0AAW1KA14_SAPOF
MKLCLDLVELTIKQTRVLVENSEESSEKLGPPVDKVFVVPPSPAAESSGSMSEGPYCVWRTAAESPSPELRRKSNSTGFYRFWRMKDLLARSNSVLLWFFPT